MKKYYGITKLGALIFSFLFILLGFHFSQHGFYQINQINLGRGNPSVAIFVWIVALGGIAGILGGVVGFFLEFFCPFIWIEQKSITFGRKFCNIALTPQTKIPWEHIISIHSIGGSIGFFRFLKSDIESLLSKLAKSE